MESESLQSYLSPGETLLWSGAPARKYRFERKHLPILFFIIPFFAFMLIPLVGLFTPDKSEQSQPDVNQVQTNAPNHPEPAKPHKDAPLFARIFIGLFILCVCLAIATGVFTMLAPQMGGSLVLGNIEYGITNQRLIIVSGKSKKVAQSIHLGTVSDIRMKEWPDGLGTITIGPDLAWPYAGSARAFAVVLGNITNPREVFQIIIRARGTF